MNTIVAAVIGVVGTLLGVWLNHYLEQRRQQSSSAPQPIPDLPSSRQSISSTPTSTSVQRPRVSSAATTSLVLGILGYIILPLIGAVAAVGMGHKALKEIRTSGGQIGGSGRAKIGLALGYIQILLYLIILLVSLGS